MTDTESIYRSIASLMFPSGLLQHFEVTGVKEVTIPAEERKGVETGELTFILEEKNVFRNAEAGHVYRPNGFYAE